MANTRGTLPETQLIELHSSITELDSFAKEITNKLSIKGLIRKENFKAAINIDVLKVYNPESVVTQLIDEDSGVVSNNESLAIGAMRVFSFLRKSLEKECWIIMGKITGKKERTIIIFYFEILNLSVYTIKPDDMGYDKFFPGGKVPENFHEN